MPDFITISCTSCGHKFHIAEDIDRIRCLACGNEHIVNRSGGIVSLTPAIAYKGTERKVILQYALNDWNGV